MSVSPYRGLQLGFLLLLGWSAPPSVAAEPAFADPLRIRIRARGAEVEAGKEIPAKAVAVWYGKGTQEPRSVELSTSKPAALVLPPGRWGLHAEAAGFWGSEHLVDLAGGAGEVTLDLWPAGTVEGGFDRQDRDAVPSPLEVFFRASPEVASSQAPPPSKVVCPIEKEVWRCLLPAGLLDARFQAAGFIPRYQWGLRVPRDGTLRLDRLDLRRGSAVQGWVVTADGSRLGERGNVELRPRLGGALRQAAEADRLKALTFKTSIHPRGFFQIEGVPPGSYVLEAKHPPYAPAVTTVRVLAGEVTEIANPPLVLEPPQTLEVYLSPPQDPWGHPWSVRLLRLDRSSSVMTNVAMVAAENGGLWRKTGLTPASYLLQVGPHGGESWHIEEVEVGGSLAALHLTLDVVPVSGSLHLGRNPLPATLQFGGRHGAVRIEARSNEEGEFELLLPRSGEWSVHVFSSKPPVNRELAKVEVRPKPGQKVAELELKLPDTRLQGRVVDEMGAPVPRALVSVRTAGSIREPQIQERVSGEGKFELLGLPPGPVQVGADADEDRTSELLTVELAEDREPAPLLLTVRPQLRISGTIVSPAGVVAGARVKAAPVGARYFGVPSVTSDAQGRFEVSLPGSTREMRVAVGAPGFAFRMLRIPVPEDKRIVVGVEQTGGTLVLETSEPHDQPDLDSPSLFVFRSTAFEGLPPLRSWALLSGETQQNPTRSVIPLMEPGEYRACWVLPAQRTAVDFGAIPQDQCAKGFLPPAGELTLRLPPLSGKASARGR